MPSKISDVRKHQPMGVEERKLVTTTGRDMNLFVEATTNKLALVRES